MVTRNNAVHIPDLSGVLRRGVGCFSMAAGLAFATALFSQEISQDFAALGRIDWSGRRLHVVGTASASPDSLQPAVHSAVLERAKRDALQKLIDLSKRICIDGDAIAAMRLADDSAVEASLAAIAANYTIEDVSLLAGEALNVSVSLNIDGRLAAFLMRGNLQRGELMVPTQPLCPLCGQNWPAGKPVPPGVILVRPPGAAPGAAAVFSGLIVDARGLEVVPALAPRIRDAAGNPVYDMTFADSERAAAIGLATYDRIDPDFPGSNEVSAIGMSAGGGGGATRLMRAGEYPYRARALAASGPYHSDIIISPGDAKVIHGAAAHQNFLKACSVVILID